MDLSNNQLTGEVPASWAQMSQLKDLDLSRNRLGTVGQLSSTTATATTALLQWKASITSPPGLLDSWQGVSACNGSTSTWYGITCDAGEVIRLRLSDAGLLGSLGTLLVNITTLQVGAQCW